jgi:hypothetical protein
MVETAKYDVILEDREFEIRLYSRMIVATVENHESAFNKLFNYISGNNKSKSKISMTSPVITSEKIAMTSPVMSTSDAMSFVAPSHYTMETIPEPLNSSIKISEIPERYMATIRFRGFAWKEATEKQKKRLNKWLNEKKIQAKGPPLLMQYNPPFIPGFLRRNEIAVEIMYEA